MKSLTFIGLILLALAGVLFYANANFSVMKLFEPTTLMGILAGVGIGLIIGGMVGTGKTSCRTGQNKETGGRRTYHKKSSVLAEDFLYRNIFS